MGQELSPDKMRAIGLQLGRERACLDLLEGMVQPVNSLWMPHGAHPVYVAAVREGYLEVATGTLEPMGL